MSNPDQSPSFERMFHAAVLDLAAINEALDLDPDDGGADPILEAIAELKARVAPTEAAAMAATVPAGYALVPQVLTKEMLYEVQENAHILPPRAHRIWEMLLAAAPQAPVAGQPADEARMLRDLLARIHGDGGQYLDKHSLAKAVQDADEMVSKWCAGQPAEPSPADSDLLAELHLLEEVCAIYANDEDRYSDGRGEAYGSVPVAAGLKARAARKRFMEREAAPKGDSNG